MTDDRSKVKRWAWWAKGECVVEILCTGHFPDTVMAKLPDDRKIEVDLNELQFNTA